MANLSYFGDEFVENYFLNFKIVQRWVQKLLLCSVKHDRSLRFLVGRDLQHPIPFAFFHAGGHNQQSDVDYHDHDSGHYQIETGTERGQPTAVPIVVAILRHQNVMSEILEELEHPADEWQNLGESREDVGCK